MCILEKMIYFAFVILTTKKSSCSEGATGYWDFKFGVADMVMGQKNVFSFVGKFYFETEKGTVYTFDNNGSDFVYNDQTACDLLQSMQAALRP